ncbi:UNKNOWN [Stylonychia lemnae]|uniref:Uncharacterized protein n=1 Tax=Stylonychia lemnae TaxID=5949 RepID=A0A078ALZ0_STYLE|nr:UNKNOWN [Stylonychia lemnae]|eukprot:CDW82427.1 UNKNOWN [Stylonychia lemnae]
MNEKGYFNKGQMHIKATLESDHQKSFLIDIQENDTILTLKKRIGEIMESSYELYRNLRNVQASQIIRRSTQAFLDDSDLVIDVLQDNEEIYFELESHDLWLHVVFNMFSDTELLVYGTTEFRIEKFETLQVLKKKLQKFSMNMWSKMLKGTESLYTLEQLDLKTEDDFSNVNMNEDRLQQQQQSASKSNQQLNLLQLPKEGQSKDPINEQQNGVQSQKPSTVKRKLFDLKLLDKFVSFTVGDFFGYKNKVFMKVVFKPFMRSQYHKQVIQTFNTNVSDDSNYTNPELSNYKLQNPFLTVMPKSIMKRASFFLGHNRRKLGPSKKTSRLTGFDYTEIDRGSIQLQQYKSVMPTEKKKGRFDSEHHYEIEKEQILLNQVTYGLVIINNEKFKAEFDKFIAFLIQQQSPKKDQKAHSNKSRSILSKASKKITEKLKEQMNPLVKVSNFSPDVSIRKKTMMVPQKKDSKPRMYSLFGQVQTQVGRSKSFKRVSESKKNSMFYSSESSSNKSKISENEELVEASISGEFVNFMDDAEVVMGQSKNNPSSPDALKEMDQFDIENQNISFQNEALNHNFFEMYSPEHPFGHGKCILIAKIHENDIQNIMKSFIITHDEAYNLKLPRIRKANVRNNINELMNDNNEDDRLDMDENHFFFDSQYGSYNLNKHYQPEQGVWERKRVRKAVKVLLVLLIILIFLAIGMTSLWMINPYGINQVIKQVLIDIYETIYSYFYEDYKEKEIQHQI